MATSATKTVLAATGGVVAAVVSTLCCAGPLVAVALGLSGAGLAATFEPLRPYFVAGTVLALGFGFVVMHRPDRAGCRPSSGHRDGAAAHLTDDVRELPHDGAPCLEEAAGGLRCHGHAGRQPRRRTLRPAPGHPRPDRRPSDPAHGLRGDGPREVSVQHGEFNIAIVGGGSAGFAAAIKGAELGARVGLIEGGTLGGTCVNVGCVPSKTLIRAAEAQHRRIHHGFRGVSTSDGRPAWPTVRAEKDALVAELRQTKYWNVLRAYPSITLFQERASLVSGHQVRLASGRTVTAGKIVVTTGASPWAPPIPGLAEAGYLDNASAMALERMPQSLVVIGGRPGRAPPVPPFSQPRAPGVLLP